MTEIRLVGLIVCLAKYVGAGVAANEQRTTGDSFLRRTASV